MAQPPKRSPDDYIHTFARSLISAIPVVGGAGAELFSMVIAPPIEKRRDEWMNDIAERLTRLEELYEEFSVQSLANNEVFITTVLHATTVAIRTHQVEKLEMLRNAVLNAALGIDVEDSIQLMVLRLVDDLTPWHLKFLKYLDAPRSYGEAKGIKYPTWSSGGPSSVIEHTFTELKGQRAFYDQLGNELNARGLISSPRFHMTMTAGGMFQSFTTEFGRSFLTFVEDPIAEA